MTEPHLPAESARDAEPPALPIHVVLTTFPGAEAAAAVGRQLVERRLAACASIVPAVRSIYRWQGEIQDETECLVVFKTATDPEDLFKAIRELHPYELPELVALPAGPVEAGYARWVREGSAAV